MASEHAELLSAFRAAVRAKIQRDLAAERAAAEARRAEVLPSVKATIAQARSQGLCGFLLSGMVSRACGRMAHVVGREAAPDSLIDRALREGVPL
jgi:hypothetical protein